MSFTKYQQALKKLERMERAERDELTDNDLNIIRLNLLKLNYLHKKSTPLKCKVMVYFHSRTKPMEYELEEIMNLIKSDTMKLESDYIQKEIKGDAEKVRLFIEKQKKFTPCGLFYTRRNRIDIRYLNGIILLENYPDNLTSAQIQLIKNEPFTYAFFRQLETNRYAILVKTSGMTSRNHKAYQYNIKEYYRNLINSDSIYSFSINRAIYLSHDKGLYRCETIKYYSLVEN